MISKNRLDPRQYLPNVLAATFLVVCLPVLAVYYLQATGRVHSPVVSIALGIAISVAMARICSAYWTRRPGSSDIVFGDLMVWGWIRRLRTERRLGRATELLGLDGRARRRGGEELSPERQAEVLQELANALEARDPYTQGHTRRVTRHSHMIAKKMGLPAEQVASIRAAAAVHDVGKMSVPREILNKPGRLTDDEFKVMKAHAQDGAEMVSRIGDPAIIAMVRHHHEQLDGSGYPDGLRGADIPLGARIIAVADTFDAITSSRPYRTARQHKDAIEVLKKSSGSQLDPDAVTAFLGYYSGKTGIAWSALIATVPQRLFNWLTGALQGAGATPVAKGAAMVGATAFLGGSLVSPGPSGHHSGTRHSRPANVIEASGYHGDTRVSLHRSKHRSSGGHESRTGSGPRTDPVPKTSKPAPDSGSGPSSGPGSGSAPGSGSGTRPASDSGSGTPDPRTDPVPTVELPRLPLPETPKVPETPKTPDLPKTSDLPLPLPKLPGPRL